MSATIATSATNANTRTCAVTMTATAMVFATQPTAFASAKIVTTDPIVPSKTNVAWLNAQNTVLASTTAHVLATSAITAINASF